MTKQTKSKKEEAKKAVKSKKQAKSKKEQPENKQSQQIDTVAPNSTLELEFDWEKEVAPVYQKKLQSAAKNIKLPGFRKGKAPTKLAEEKVGRSQLIQATLQEIVPPKYTQAIKENKQTPLTEPEFIPLSLEKGETWKLKAVFAEKPEIEIKGYEKITKKAKKQAEDTIEEMKKKAKDQKKADKDESKKDKAETKNKKDQRPAELSPEQIKDIKIQTIFGKLVEELKPAIPELLIKQNTKQEIHKFEHQLKDLNIKLEDYLKSQQLSFEQFSSRIAYSSLSRLQVEFLIDAISRQEEIEATKEEVEAKIKAVEDENLRKQLEKDVYYQNYLKATIVKQKVIDHLLSI